MTDTDSHIAELEARNAALIRYAVKMKELALCSSYRRLRASEQIMYLLRLVDKHKVPIDLERFYSLGSHEPEPDEPPPPIRRADIRLIN
jgi:hypothetical protein